MYNCCMKVEHIICNNVNNRNKNNISFKGLYDSRFLKKGLEFASDNGVLFSSVVCVALSSVFRPIAVLLTPKAKKEDKQYTCARSITSGLLGFGITMAITTPIVKAVDNIAKNADKYLKPATIKALKGNSKNLRKSGAFGFVTQMVKLGSQFLTAEPKAYLSCALVPPLMSFLFKTDPHPNDEKSQTEKIVYIGNSKVNFGKNSENKEFKGNFKGLGQSVTNGLSKGISKFFNWKPIQKAANKYKDTNFAQHLFSLNDIYLTALFVKYTDSNKDIKESRKKTLNYNAMLQTGLTIPISYGIVKLLDKPTERFISKLSAVNKNDPKLHKYIEGVKIAKPALIMGILYYIFAPVVSTVLADVVSNKIDGNKENKNDK